MKKLVQALTITGVIVFIWFALSFHQVVSQNTNLGQTPEYSSWNMFMMID